MLTVIEISVRGINEELLLPQALAEGDVAILRLVLQLHLGADGEVECVTHCAWLLGRT